jgi:tetratricopeptide (TPR) repeat protein
MSISSGETVFALGGKSAVLGFVMCGAIVRNGLARIQMQLTAAPLFSRVLLPVVAAFAASGAVDAATDTSWLDVEGRIQYGFYTEDARALADIADQLSHVEGEREPLQYYYTALANYRLATLLASRDKEHAREAIEHCVDSLDGALKAEADFAAGLALQSACLRTMATLKPWKALAGSKSVGQMERAVKLAPRDPRVLLLEALAKGEDAKLDEKSLATLKKAAAAFETERQGVDRTPGWGAAEAYAYLGRGYLERGDVLNARDALERALLIAPDFALAKRLLTKITTG